MQDIWYATPVKGRLGPQKVATHKLRTTLLQRAAFACGEMDSRNVSTTLGTNFLCDIQAQGQRSKYRNVSSSSGRDCVANRRGKGCKWMEPKLHSRHFTKPFLADYFVFYFWDKISRCSPGFPQPDSDFPVPASSVLDPQACAVRALHIT